MLRKMIIDFIKNKAELIRKILPAVILVLTVLIVVKIATLAVSLIRTPLLIRTAIAQGTISKDKIIEYLDADKEKVESLKKKNMFAIPPPPQAPPVVIGILGKSALINGKWYKVGEEVSGAKILRIEPTQIVIEWQGKEKQLAPLLAKTDSSKNGSDKKKVKKKRDRTGKKVRQKAQEEAGEKVTAEEDDPLAWMGVKLSPALRAKIMEGWNQMSDEQKEQSKEEWNKMSDEQKENAINGMEQQL